MQPSPVLSPQITQLLQLHPDKTTNYIQYSKWKQNLVLGYSYIPLQNIKDRLDNDYKLYVKKLKEGEAVFKRKLNNEWVEQQVEFFRELAVRVDADMRDIEGRIELRQMENLVRLAQAKEKKQMLKQIVKGTSDLSKVMIARTASCLKEIHKIQPKPMAKSQYGTAKKPSLRSQTTAKSTIHSQTPALTAYSTEQTFQACVSEVIRHLRRMNKSQDVQSGIYLDIMRRKLQMKTCRSSSKSKICDVLMERYKDLKSDRPKQPEDFHMNYETFQAMNWKQIMGILLVKDPNGDKLRRLLAL